MGTVFAAVENLLLILAAFLLGLLVGWLIWRRATTTDVSTTSRVSELESELAATRAKADAHASASGRLTSLEAELAAERQRADTHAAAGARLSDLEAELARERAKAKPDPALQSRIATLESDLAAARSAGGTATDLQGRVTALEAELAREKARADAHARELADARNATAATSADRASFAATTAPAASPVARAVDDLIDISGIGPKLKEVLHGLDITTFRQIALLDQAGIDRLSEHLGDFKDRVEREDWVGQARELHRAKYGEDPR